MNTANNSATAGITGSSPFQLGDDDLYQRWRDAKLERYPESAESLVVEITDAHNPGAAELAHISRVCAKTNMAIYATVAGDLEDRSIARTLGDRLGLRHLDPNMLADEDGITSLTVVEGKSGRGYIPYSSHRLLWHTDGYYNLPEHRIRAMLLHCVRPAAEGGENMLLDPEIVYILMREADPDHIAALMQPDAMTIPANTETGVETREARTGPVFSIDSATGDLHMRYTARTRSIEWKPDDATRAAVTFLEELLESGSPYIFNNKLSAGQGLVCNNVLHNRTAFTDNETAPRLVYRARYYERIANTEWKRLIDGDK
ncbi:MAG: TauD/TfdA family dioxygenase [Acidiferrobacterales bacterium]|nr:TauD/TfdA family dioxygenase [Acidiferrobacterales bacterium]